MNNSLNIFFEFYSRFNKNISILILLFSIIVAVLFVCFIEININLINLISVVLSIIIGLMFNFSSSLSNKISSEHLTIRFKFKKERLIKLEKSYKSAYFSIYISILCLIICLILMVVNYYYFKIIGTVILIFLLIQMFISFYFVLNDMKNFVEYDIKQEKKNIEKKRLNEINEN